MSRILSRQVSQEVREIPKHYLWKIFDTKSIGIVLKRELWSQGVDSPSGPVEQVEGTSPAVIISTRVGGARASHRLLLSAAAPGS